MRPAGRGIDLGADAGANNPTRTVNEVTVDARPMVRILFENGEVTARRAVPGLAGRDRTIGCDFLADHQIRALLWKRHNDVHVVGSRLFKQRLIYL